MKKHICTHCGEEFTGRKRKYCNDKCRHEYDKVRQRKQYRLDNNIKSRSCPICDKEFEPNRNGALTKYCSQNCADEARRTRNRERWRKQNIIPNDIEWIKNKVPEGWEYIGGYKNGNPNSIIQLRCKDCGYVKEIVIKVAKRFEVLNCDNCWVDPRNKYGTQDDWLKAKRPMWDKQIEETRKRKEAERLAKIETKECTECGKEFETHIKNKVTCSKECSRKRANRLRSDYHSNRYNEDNYIDRDISLERLYQRDEGICYICGGACDYEDYSVDGNGYFTAGPNYPSIDHILPIARGGMHSWDNVKLAHHYCNSLKVDQLPSEFFDEPIQIDIDEAYALARTVSPKKKEVKQYTRDKELINIYESTAEASRQTGIKVKGIQKCARGECATYKGYIWEY